MRIQSEQNQQKIDAANSKKAEHDREESRVSDLRDRAFAEGARQARAAVERAQERDEREREREAERRQQEIEDREMRLHLTELEDVLRNICQMLLETITTIKASLLERHCVDPNVSSALKALDKFESRKDILEKSCSKIDELTKPEFIDRKKVLSVLVYEWWIYRVYQQIAAMMYIYTFPNAIDDLGVVRLNHQREDLKEWVEYGMKRFAGMHPGRTPQTILSDLLYMILQNTEITTIEKTSILKTLRRVSGSDVDFFDLAVVVFSDLRKRKSLFDAECFREIFDSFVQDDLTDSLLEKAAIRFETENQHFIQMVQAAFTTEEKLSRVAGVTTAILLSRSASVNTVKFKADLDLLLRSFWRPDTSIRILHALLQMHPSTPVETLIKTKLEEYESKKKQYDIFVTDRLGRIKAAFKTAPAIDKPRMYLLLRDTQYSEALRNLKPSLILRTDQGILIHISEFLEPTNETRLQSLLAAHYCPESSTDSMQLFFKKAGKENRPAPIADQVLKCGQHFLDYYGLKSEQKQQTEDFIKFKGLGAILGPGVLAYYFPNSFTYLLPAAVSTALLISIPFHALSLRRRESIFQKFGFLDPSDNTSSQHLKLLPPPPGHPVRGERVSRFVLVSCEMFCILNILAGFLLWKSSPVAKSPGPALSSTINTIVKTPPPSGPTQKRVAKDSVFDAKEFWALLKANSLAEAQGMIDRAIAESPTDSTLYSLRADLQLSKARSSTTNEDKLKFYVDMRADVRMAIAYSNDSTFKKKHEDHLEKIERAILSINQTR